ncbi:methylmalonyl-CoA mutase [Sporichthya sp.]|uniref:acyl-CoA mutase large subunit family protein n=1 Tax=Sporichthya sp. TaxID=65475 RepID=UPI0017FADEF0|nr:methylmalonyl-CoA mutase family protein [Sporichthya sp.]MBA3744087.1 methylmalonyl-CoA mutase [Sporichthya sp.]
MTDESLAEGMAAWREKHAAKLATVTERPSLLGAPLDVLYAPTDGEVDAAAYGRDIGLPGEFPYTRGVYPAMYRDRLWQMRLYSGFGDAESTNTRWQFLLAHGNNGVSAAFDLPTQVGMDSDHPEAVPEAGRVGVAVDCAQDFERMFAGLPVEQMGISLNAHSTAPFVLALFLAAMERQGITPGQINGSMTTDVLKDYVARGTWIYPPGAGIRMVCDILEFCSAEMPRFYPLVIRGPDIRDAGADAIQEVAFAFANAVTYLENAQARGLDIDGIATRLSAQFYYYGDFLQEAAKTRAARRIWSRLLRDRFGARKEASWLLRVTASVGGTHFQVHEPETNIVRGTLGCLGAVLGGVQGMLLAGYDEAFDIPTEDTARIALRTQQIVGYESDATAVPDPLGGSWFVEAMTDEIERLVLAKMAEIDEMGGSVVAIESGYMQREIAKSAYNIERREQSGEKPIVAVNIHRGQGEPPELVVHAPDSKVADRQRAQLAALRAGRDEVETQRRLARLRAAGEGTDNLMPIMIDCARADATLGEMVDVLRGVFGEFKEPAL